MPDTTTRTYRSALRTEQAAATRRRVLDAAAASFAERGYHGSSLADIGARAGVSTETVKANGPKRDLLLRAFEQAFAGVEGDAQIADGDAAAALDAVADLDAYLASAAVFVAAANARTSVLWTEFLSAANTDEAVARELADLLDRRRRDYRLLAEQLRARGLGDAGLPIDEAAAALSFLWSPESHQQLVLQSGWAMERYEHWLTETARRHLGR
ncbi:TetR family transcriptional regulator [Agromyces aerolatus]|uniref:TetR family transcriptional regulator n=1 Tax=Agromyces sp. LY-1074 TaxID=3074080 RepID=UPI0028663377|nr:MULTISPECIES: TetR family transcriptional regulator [unclassified Agromyces]MDR5700028.1 TetR family transcriptional regulator [Agromyces sp. LY-1074]MDR5706160.1 TetR family transcriptional regulator [Agromyces sp. LY-1358]